jgi:hypothetical protein
MPRYHLHIYHRAGVSCDEEGLDLPDLITATTYAIDGIRSIASEEVRGGRLDLDGRVDIADDSGTILDSVRVAEAVEVLPPEEAN